MAIERPGSGAAEFDEGTMSRHHVLDFQGPVSDTFIRSWAPVRKLGQWNRHGGGASRQRCWWVNCWIKIEKAANPVPTILFGIGEA